MFQFTVCTSCLRAFENIREWQFSGHVRIFSPFFSYFRAQPPVGILSFFSTFSISGIQGFCALSQPCRITIVAILQNSCALALWGIAQLSRDILQNGAHRYVYLYEGGGGVAPLWRSAKRKDFRLMCHQEPFWLFWCDIWCKMFEKNMLCSETRP